MAKKKQRTPYLIKEPNWAKHTLAESDEDKKQAWDNSWYFIHYEISSKECYNSFRHWTKTHSNWTKADRKKVLEAPDWAYLSISEYTYFHSKVGYMTTTQEEYIYSKYDYFLQTAEKKKAEKAKTVERKVVPIRQELDLWCSAQDEAIDKLSKGFKV